MVCDLKRRRLYDFFPKQLNRSEDILRASLKKKTLQRRSSDFYVGCVILSPLPFSSIHPRSHPMQDLRTKAPGRHNLTNRKKKNSSSCFFIYIGLLRPCTSLTPLVPDVCAIGVARPTDCWETPSTVPTVCRVRGFSCGSYKVRVCSWDIFPGLAAAWTRSRADCGVAVAVPAERCPSSWGPVRCWR